MPTVRGCNLPDDLLYDVDNHIWFTEQPDGTVRLWTLPVVPRPRAEEIVRRQKDPALVEWMGMGVLRTRIFPIQPGETRTTTATAPSGAPGSCPTRCSRRAW